MGETTDVHTDKLIFEYGIERVNLKLNMRGLSTALKDVL